MDNETFKIEVENSHNRSKRVLIRKEAEYSSGKDRLDQFHRAASAQNINPCEALIGMATKHFTSIADMAKDPTIHTMKQWREKTGDLRNYTILLEALLIDIGVK
uniref:Uncharacterized protein n=1 Tax=viral metagenome TaxID=1070528 RepID=A0A6M3ITI3_9ZZZZ